MKVGKNRCFAAYIYKLAAASPYVRTDDLNLGQTTFIFANEQILLSKINLRSTCLHEIFWDIFSFPRKPMYKQGQRELESDQSEYCSEGSKKFFGLAEGLSMLYLSTKTFHICVSYVMIKMTKEVLFKLFCINSFHTHCV